jgi:lipopolysaccharide/colanic/teichoic acid biosynthesis glycosyltransferase
MDTISPSQAVRLSPAIEPSASTRSLAKRVVDCVGSAAALLLLGPVLALIAIMIKAEDGGPVIYRRRVVGIDGEFDAFKFRSMRVDADEVLKQNEAMRREFEVSFKLKSDPRITKFGGWMRKLSLDEFPQLVNVLRGQMSLVGPRMITPPELDKYGDQRDLLRTAKPGLTGYWQVNGRQKTSYEERVRMDVHYIQNWSFWLDVKILLATPWVVLKREGAF